MRWLLLFPVLIGMSSVSEARDANAVTKSELKFTPGTTSATTQDSLVRGETHWIEFGANAGQTLNVSIASLEDNASFRLYVVSPYGGDGSNRPFQEADGLPGIDIERTAFSGPLPFGSKDGNNSVYAVEVGASRGNAQYTLTVSIQ